MRGNHIALSILALVGISSLAVALRVAPDRAGSDSLASTARAGESTGGPYAADSGHIWNRLHNALHVRVGPDGKRYGAERLDPLLWSWTKHLRQGPSHEAALAVLEEFRSSNAETQVLDPLKRAMFQRDLWAVFDWYAGWNYANDSDGWGKGRVDPAFVGLLAGIIRRVALTPQQIQNLPRNYEAAIASKAFAEQHDPGRTKRPFLPPDLLRPNSSWVRLGQAWGGNVVPQHLEEFGGRSVFTVFVRLPQGRQATLQYLRRLEKLEKRNEELPQFPVGTQFALVRRMLLVDAQGQLQVSPLVESVQLRVYLEIPERRDRRVVAETLKQQAVFEFVLDRTKLFRGESGGLRAVDPAEEDFATFQTHGIDPFEPGEHLRPDYDFAKWQHPVLNLCVVCHSGSGVVSVRSRLSLGTDDDGSGLSRELEKTMYWKRQRYEWGLLQGLTATSDPACRR